VIGGTQSFLGGFAGANLSPALIDASTASGSVTATGSGSEVGGFVGRNSNFGTNLLVPAGMNPPGTITNSSSSGPVIGTSASYLGGFAGLNSGLIQNDASSSNVIGTGGNNIAGGLVGINFGVIDSSNPTGSVTSGPNSTVGKSLKDRGIILIGAAGNAGPKSPPLFPGADPNVIGVSATDLDDKTFKGANHGKQVAIAAPGVEILVPAPEGGYQLTTGTSVAAAEVSGVVALMLERNPRLSPADVRNILTATAKKLPQGRLEVGAGLVDPVQALAKSGPKQARAH
jgi:subtilase family protein/GLUG motif-containing protein